MALAGAGYVFIKVSQRTSSSDNSVGLPPPPGSSKLIYFSFLNHQYVYDPHVEPWVKARLEELRHGLEAERERLFPTPVHVHARNRDRTPSVYCDSQGSLNPHYFHRLDDFDDELRPMGHDRRDDVQNTEPRTGLLGSDGTNMMVGSSEERSICAQEMRELEPGSSIKASTSAIELLDISGLSHRKVRNTGNDENEICTGGALAKTFSESDVLNPAVQKENVRAASTSTGGSTPTLTPALSRRELDGSPTQDYDDRPPPTVSGSANAFVITERETIRSETSSPFSSDFLRGHQPETEITKSEFEDGSSSTETETIQSQTTSPVSSDFFHVEQFHDHDHPIESTFSSPTLTEHSNLMSPLRPIPDLVQLEPAVPANGFNGESQYTLIPTGFRSPTLSAASTSEFSIVSAPSVGGSGMQQPMQPFSVVSATISSPSLSPSSSSFSASPFQHISPPSHQRMKNVSASATEGYTRGTTPTPSQITVAIEGSRELAMRVNAEAHAHAEENGQLQSFEELEEWVHSGFTSP